MEYSAENTPLDLVRHTQRNTLQSKNTPMDLTVATLCTLHNVHLCKSASHQLFKIYFAII